MATVATRTAIHLSHVTEILELAETILMRTPRSRFHPQGDHLERLFGNVPDVSREGLR